MAKKVKQAKKEITQAKMKMLFKKHKIRDCHIKLRRLNKGTYFSFINFYLNCFFMRSSEKEFHTQNFRGK